MRFKESHAESDELGMEAGDLKKKEKKKIQNHYSKNKLVAKFINNPHCATVILHSVDSHPPELGDRGHGTGHCHSCDTVKTSM